MHQGCVGGNVAVQEGHIHAPKARTTSGTRTAYLLLFTDGRPPGDWATTLGDGKSVAGFDGLKHAALPRPSPTEMSLGVVEGFGVDAG